MDFDSEIFDLAAPSSKKFDLLSTNWPTSTDLYFRSKQKEIIDQYAAARIFLRETETDDWKHWFSETEDKVANSAFKLIFTSYFFEIALMYYNIVVDLSWTLCYVSAEFACSHKGQRVNFSGMKSLDDAAILLRSAENNVTPPTAETNPFTYLKAMNSNFSKAIDLIIDFWNTFSSTTIRSWYNYCKHKGKPAYSEIEELRGGRLFETFIEEASTGKKTQLATDIVDVQYLFSLKEGIEELHKFDNSVLYRYLKDLLNELEKVINRRL